MAHFCISLQGHNNSGLYYRAKKSSEADRQYLQADWYGQMQVVITLNVERAHILITMPRARGMD
jgi:hypothetical protein